jgi:alpha-L-fucosidase
MTGIIDYPLHNDDNKIADSKADMQRYVLYMKNQLKELISNYHPYMLWFDGIGKSLDTGRWR